MDPALVTYVYTYQGILFHVSLLFRPFKYAGKLFYWRFRGGGRCQRCCYAVLCHAVASLILPVWHVGQVWWLGVGSIGIGFIAVQCVDLKVLKKKFTIDI